MYLERIVRGAAPLLAAVLLLSACGEDKAAEPAPEIVPEEGVLASRTARVKFMGGDRYATSLSRALDIPRLELCKELSSFDCVDVHDITLGGVEPYEQRINEPLPSAPVTAPIAIDRLALSACSERTKRDFADPAEAVFFGDLAESGEDDALEEAAEKLYSRIMRRSAQPNEVELLVAFMDDVEQEVGDRDVKAWATMACFTVATTQEALFY